MKSNLKIVTLDNKETKWNTDVQEHQIKRLFKALSHANDVDEQLSILRKIGAENGYSTEAKHTYTYNMGKDYRMVQVTECKYDTQKGCFVRGKRRDFILI